MSIENNLPQENNSLENYNERQLTSKQLYEQATQKEADGNKKDAAKLYEQAGYNYKAIKIYQELGDFQEAYKIAKQSEDNWTADKLALEHNIPEHEFMDFPNTGKGISEDKRVALQSRLQEGATGEKLGFSGFKNKVVADIGTSSGTLISLFNQLGAKEVYGIEPDMKRLEEAVKNGFLDKRHAINKLLQDIPEDVRKKIEIAAIFNFNMPLSEYENFFKSAYNLLPKNGQMIMTVAEDEILTNARPFAEKYFITKSQRIFGKEQENYPHKNLVLCIKKSEI